MHDHPGRLVDHDDIVVLVRIGSGSASASGVGSIGSGISTVTICPVFTG
jgi:hypothetical protein